MKLGALLEMPNGDSPITWRGEDWTKQGMASFNIDAEMARRQFEVVDWLNSLFPDLNMAPDASEEELKAQLLDGTILTGILRRFSPESLEETKDGDLTSSEMRLDYIRRFCSAVELLELPSFKVSELEQGPISAVVYCLWSLKDHLGTNVGGDKDADSPVKSIDDTRKELRPLEKNLSVNSNVLRGEDIPSGTNSPVLGERRRHSFSESRFQRIFRSAVMSEPSTPQSHQGGYKFHEVFQLRQGRYSDLPAAKITEMMKSNSLDNAPTQSLLSVVNGILEESIDRKNGEIPYRVACLLRKVVQEIERRISTQAEHIRNQNNLIKAREEKYQSRIKVLETLANGSTEEAQIVMNELQQLKTEKSKIEERKKLEDEDMARLMKEKENNDQLISELKHDLQTMKKSYDEQFEQLKTKAIDSQMELEKQVKEAETLLQEARKKIQELEAASESKLQNWNQKENIVDNFIHVQLQSLQDLRLSSDCIKHEVVNTQKRWSDEIASFGEKLKVLTDAAENYHTILAENRRLYNEVQELKGNIRVYCRIRPFLPGENQKQTAIEYIGENGELLLSNPSKPGKDGQRMFKFNKVFGPAATQEEVFLDTQPLVRSVLDGYNVCIFAYGQTGSGKTYTMSGPNSASEKDWGVNYRALNDLFHISRNRRDTFMYEVGVQMVEIYNEQVRDLLANDGSQKRLGILITTQPNGIAVPAASMHPVTSTSDVLDLMQIGQANRAVGATALNERSSRSHSILTVHVRGMDFKTGATLRGSLHLVDLAGSERVDRSEVTGDRLKEAQHINKSLSALGDVIFALSQKSTHVPYRNSKLTQVLQTSLGGHAKTLMFVQINPDIGSFSETVSTLKFAERVSGVELGAAKSQKEGKDIRDLMEQVASLKDTIARKDEEIEQLQLLKDVKSRSTSIKSERQTSNLHRHSSSSPGAISMLPGSTQERRLSAGSIVSNSKSASDLENCVEYSPEHSECGSQKSIDDSKHHRDILGQQKLNGGVTGQSSTDLELLGFGDADSEERLSDISDSGLSMGTETDGSIGSIVEFSLFPEHGNGKPSQIIKERKNKIPVRIPKPPPQKTGQIMTSRSRLKDTTKSPGTKKVTTSQTTASSTTKPPRRWQ